MEKQRRIAKGTFSEIFGPDSLFIDIFMRNLGLYRGAKAHWESNTLDQEAVEIFQAFSDGVNDYVEGVALFSNDQKTARLLPPEFLAFGITVENYEPWTPIDSLLMFRLVSF